MRVDLDRFGLPFLVAIVFAVAAMSPIACAAEVAKIGTIGGFTGPHSSVDLPALEGLRMAVKEINDAGGFDVAGKKYKFELDEQDNQSKTEQSVVAAQKILNSDGVSIILGTNISVTGLAIANLVKQSDAVMIGGFTAMGSIAGTEGYELMFRSLPHEDVVAPPFVDAVMKELQLKKIGFILPNDDISRSIVAAYEPLFKAKGVEIAGVAYFQTDTLDFAPVLRQFQNKGLDGLFIGYNDNAVAPLVRQSFELGSLPINFVYRGGSGAPAVPYIDKIGGFTWQILTRDVENPVEQKVKDFVTRYKAFTGKPIASNTYFALTYYDTMFMLIKAMQAAKSTTDTKAIAAELKKIKYDGVRNMYYDDKGLVHSDLDVGIVKKNGTPYSIPVSVK